MRRRHANGGGTRYRVPPASGSIELGSDVPRGIEAESRDVLRPGSREPDHASRARLAETLKNNSLGAHQVPSLPARSQLGRLRLATDLSADQRIGPMIYALPRLQLPSRAGFYVPKRAYALRVQRPPVHMVNGAA